ncbi:MAG: hypothetical protein AB1778_06320 [Candidatus Bipolaricaulota bacterium]
MHIERQRVCWGVLAATIVALTTAVAAADMRWGGRVEAWGSAVARPGASGAATLFLGLPFGEVAARTEFAFLPYILGTQALSISAGHDELSLTGEYTWTLIPLGITSASVTARARPHAWTAFVGDIVFDAAFEGDARLSGIHFASVPLRTELWARLTAGASRRIEGLGRIRLATAISSTSSVPNPFQLWPLATLSASLEVGAASLRSETTFLLAPLRFDSERLVVDIVRMDFGFSAEASLTFTQGTGHPAIGLRVGYAFGDLQRFGRGAEGSCEGGVCR